MQFCGVGQFRHCDLTKYDNKLDDDYNVMLNDKCHLVSPPSPGYLPLRRDTIMYPDGSNFTVEITNDRLPCLVRERGVVDMDSPSLA